MNPGLQLNDAVHGNADLIKVRQQVRLVESSDDDIMLRSVLRLIVCIRTIDKISDYNAQV